MTHDLNTLLSWRGRTVLDREGETIGKLGDLYLDERTDLPAYAGVRTGLFGRHESILPLAGIVERDDDLIAPYAAQQVRDAPAIDPDESLGDEDQERLARHYDADVAPPRADAEDHDGAGDGDEGVIDMTRSEEEIVTGTTPMQPAERVRIRKVLVTEDVKRTVPVRREVIQLATEPPPEGDIESATDVEDDRDAT
jgi:hypothetical protein